MGKRKKPKFEIGETVVITVYGTVGNITNIKWLDGKYFYEINNNEGLFTEESLQLFSEYDEELLEKEQIDIVYQFIFGDIVQVAGYGTDLFRVVGFRTEIWRYKEDAWEDVIYELSRITDGEWLEAGEEELSLVAEAETAEAFLQNLGYLYMMDQTNPTLKLPEPKDATSKSNKSSKNPKKVDENNTKVIDNLLDIYNDYDVLYQMFNDNDYEKIKKGIIRKLKRMTNKEE